MPSSIICWKKLLVAGFVFNVTGFVILVLNQMLVGIKTVQGGKKLLNNTNNKRNMTLPVPY